METNSSGVQNRQADARDFRTIELVVGWLALVIGILGLSLVVTEAIAYPAETCATWAQGSCTEWTSTRPDLLAATLICALFVTVPTVSLGAALLSRRRWANQLIVILALLAALVALFFLLMTQYSDTTGLTPLAQWNWSRWGEDLLQFSTMRAFVSSVVADLIVFIVAVVAVLRQRRGRRTAHLVVG